VFFREEYAVCVTPYRVLVVPINSFLPSLRGLEFLLFDGGAGVLLQSQWGVLGLCVLWGGRPPSTSKVSDCYSVEELACVVAVFCHCVAS
jgi:hypothetical protein